MRPTWEDAAEAHKYSNNHKPELEKDKRCGCFYCLEIFSPSEIEEWYFYDDPCDRRGTAFCPYCGIDSVIGESSGFPITKDFLSMMHRRWFESGVGLSLTTPFGDVKLFVDGEERPFRYHAIDKDSRLFPDVDGVEQISVKFEPDGKKHTLCLKLSDCGVGGEIEGGECLEALSFYCGEGKITLGCRASFGACEEYDLDYDGNYYPDGVEICILPNTKTDEYYFGVCWINKCTDENDVQTWFGADPSSWNIKRNGD